MKLQIPSYLEKVKDVTYVNDSKATNFDATLKSIESSRNLNKEGNIYLICGGDLKEQNLSEENAVIFKEIKKCFIYGKDKNRIKNYYHLLLIVFPVLIWILLIR